MHYMTLVGNSSNSLEITKLLEKMCSELLTAKFVTLWRVRDENLFSLSVDKDNEVVLRKKKGLVYESYKTNTSSIHNLLITDKKYQANEDNVKGLAYKDMLLFPLQDENDKIIAIVQACTHSNDLQQFTQNDLNVLESVCIFLAKVLVSMENDSLDIGNRQEEKFVEKSEEIVKKLQNDLVIAEKKVEIRTQFLAEIAHEIRTPMHAMMGFVELLREEETDERKHLYLDNAYKSAESMVLLLNDTLDFTKVDKGEMRLELKESSLLREMYSMVSMFYMKMKLSKINFFAYIDPLIPSKILTDTLRIRQVLSNLLSNAIKFTPAKGTILLEIVYDEKKGTLKFYVRDTGIGIAKENQEKIFSQYTQEYDSTSRQYGGTGLGLSISLQLVELFGSKIELESDAGKGSCFYFTLNIKNEVLNKKSEFDTKLLSKHKPLLLFTKNHAYLQDEIKRSYLRLGMEKTNITQASNLKDINPNDFSHIYASEALINNNILQEFLDKAKSLYVLKDQDSEYKKLEGHVYELEGLVFAHDINNKIIEQNAIDNNVIKNKTILTVDDNPINLDLMESILNTMGAKVLRANDGLDAVSIYKDTLSSKKTIDMIFMDQNMPGMTGTDAACAIKAYEIEQKIPATTIIGLCGTQSDALQDKFEEAGMLDCLCKPVCLETIKKTVVKYIEAS